MQQQLLKMQLSAVQLHFWANPLAADPEDDWLRILLYTTNDAVFEHTSCCWISPDGQYLEGQERALSGISSWAKAVRENSACCPYLLLVRLQHQHGRVQEVGDCPGVMLEEEMHFDLQRGDVENGELFKVVGISCSLVPREHRREAKERRQRPKGLLVAAIFIVVSTTLLRFLLVVYIVSLYYKSQLS